MEQVICKKCGSVDDFKTSNSGVHIRADCNGCGSFIKFLSQSPGREPICYVGKYTGKPFALIDDSTWLQWCLDNRPFTDKVKNQFLTRLTELKNGNDPNRNAVSGS